MRSGFLSLLAAVALALVAVPSWAFDFDDVANRARELAQAPYKTRAPVFRGSCTGSTTTSYRDIRFRPERALWRDAKLPFELLFFHQGLYFDQPVRINEVEPATACARSPSIPTPSTTARTSSTRRSCASLGFAGFRVHYPLNTPSYKDEVLVFQGASYFRALGKGQRYGLSARGLAIDTARRVGRGVPALRRVLDRAARAERDARSTIYALLDSRRVDRRLSLRR